MGLDMYAARRLYVKNWEHLKPEDRHTVQIARGGKSVSGIDPERVSVVEEEVMQWRKANHIHGWFVDNVMDGEDENDGRSYYVSEENLRDLLGVCRTVIQASNLVKGTVNAGTVYDKDHPNGLALREAGRVIEDATVAKELLPARQGFFFGNYEYDEDYLNDVKATRDWAIRMLADRKAGVPGELYYSSSW
jgi:hypothetical protein